MTDLSRDTGNFIEDFLQGQMDASKGVEHKAGKSGAYNRGYASQYESEQKDSEKMRRAL